jgi:hypothetical protein
LTSAIKNHYQSFVGESDLHYQARKESMRLSGRWVWMAAVSGHGRMRDRDGAGARSDENSYVLTFKDNRSEPAEPVGPAGSSSSCGQERRPVAGRI